MADSRISPEISSILQDLSGSLPADPTQAAAAAAFAEQFADKLHSFYMSIEPDSEFSEGIQHAMANVAEAAAELAEIASERAQ